MNWRGNGIFGWSEHNRPAGPTNFQPIMRYERRPGPGARSHDMSLLFGQHDDAWIDRLVLIIRIIVDGQQTISLKRYGVADDLAV